MPLNRNSILRENQKWIEGQKKSSNCLVTVVRNDENLVTCDDAGGIEIIMSSGDLARSLLKSTKCQIYLGHQNANAVFAVDLSVLDQIQVDGLLENLEPEAQFLDLRKTGPFLSPQEGATLAYARGICHWQQQNQFCGQCGSNTEPHYGGLMRKCSNSGCAREIFPRIDPAVIMLVELTNPRSGIPKCLLGRHQGLPPRIYSTLAGYVEIGETLEEAVAREVMEEVGVKINSVKYMGSQPWPFPSSLMLGFVASSTQSEITVDYNELEDARWFDANELAELDGANSESSIALPRKDSIARALIETWLKKNHE